MYNNVCWASFVCLEITLNIFYTCYLSILFHFVCLIFFLLLLHLSKFWKCLLHFATVIDALKLKISISSFFPKLTFRIFNLSYIYLKPYYYFAFDYLYHRSPIVWEVACFDFKGQCIFSLACNLMVINVVCILI